MIFFWLKRPGVYLNNFVIFLLCLFFLTGCFESKPELQPVNIVVNDIPEDFFIPKELLKKLEQELLLESKILTLNFSYIPLKVLFSEKTPHTLVSESLLYTLPKGGGQIDLQKVIVGQGTFYISFPENQFQGIPELAHLYFISLAPKIKIEQQEIGIGCGKWLDLNSQFSSLQKKEFLNLNTSDNRHIFVSVGHYIFVFRKLNQVFLTQVTITDSKNTAFLCPQPKVVLR